HRATNSHTTTATMRDAPTARRTATPPRPPCATHPSRDEQSRHPHHHPRRGVPRHIQPIRQPHVSTPSSLTHKKARPPETESRAFYTISWNLFRILCRF
ncbi:MAG: hypothetical protein ACKOZV_07875, partial [Bacteroidota bacterium]